MANKRVQTDAPLHPHAPDIAAPPWHLLALEARVLAEALGFLLRRQARNSLPRGDGHPVMVVPGFGFDDRVSIPLRSALSRLGYAVHGWGHGVNLGMRGPIKAGLAQRLESLVERYDSRVSLIGWSLGGVFVREMARQQPHLVRRVFTLGSPINGHPDANNMVALYRLANRRKPQKTDLEGFMRRRVAPPVPCTAIYSRRDGIVAWPCCLEEPAPNTENVEVRGCHLGLICNGEVLAVLAERLVQPIPPRESS